MQVVGTNHSPHEAAIEARFRFGLGAAPSLPKAVLLGFESRSAPGRSALACDKLRYPVLRNVTLRQKVGTHG
jgi:hypothetical protein